MTRLLDLAIRALWWSSVPVADSWAWVSGGRR